MTTNLQTKKALLNKIKQCRAILPNIGNKISIGFKVLMPYMSFIAVILCVINLIYLSEANSKMEEQSSMIRRNSNSISEVIEVIEGAEYRIENRIHATENNIISHIEEAKKDLSFDIFMWRRR